MPPPNVSAVDGFSLSSVYLRLFFNDEGLGSATGLLARDTRGRLLLITALHNFTGREPDGRCKRSDGGVPNVADVTGFHFHARVALYTGGNDPNSDHAVFFVHPGGPQIDISVLPLNRDAFAASSLDPSFLDPAHHAARVTLAVGELCFVIGYPEGLFVQHSARSVLPIWKTGHIASEPSIHFNGAPKLLIDAATRKGTSGSPVYVREGNFSRLVGIYTGRTSETSELGFVFNPEVILTIIEQS